MAARYTPPRLSSASADDEALAADHALGVPDHDVGAGRPPLRRDGGLAGEDLAFPDEGTGHGAHLEGGTGLEASHTQVTAGGFGHSVTAWAAAVSTLLIVP